MALTSNANWGLLLAERAGLGQKLLRLAVISLMSISIVPPVVHLGEEFWLKLDYLLLPVVALIYLCLLLAGLASPIRLNPMFAVAFAFSVCILSSLAYGTEVLGHPLLARNFFELAKPWFPAIFFTLAYEADFSEESLRTLGKSLFPATLLICLYAYGQWFNMGFTQYLDPYYSGGLHDEGGLAHYRRVYSTLSNPNTLGIFMTWVIGAFSLRALLGIGNRFLNMVLLFACLATLAMTGSRYGLIDTFLVFLLILRLPAPTETSEKKRRRILLVSLPLVVGVVLVVSASNRATLDRFQMLQTPLHEKSLRTRLDVLWKDAIEQFLQSPVLGHGPARDIFTNVFTDSEYLQILKQYGLVGLVPYLCFFLVPLRMIYKGLKSVDRAGPWLEQNCTATYWALCLSFVMTVIALVMNIGMGTYYDSSLVAFLWIWMGIGAGVAARITRALRTAPELLHG